MRSELFLGQIPAGLPENRTYGADIQFLMLWHRQRLPLPGGADPPEFHVTALLRHNTRPKSPNTAMTSFPDSLLSLGGMRLGFQFHGYQQGGIRHQTQFR